eukprot:CAMPEP_0194164620 /NCGR_PEP_ID=MMETSP0154-20130528/721_1 /TAXON_ID=1049557 /ORGANISM="Thalassiothrix antarctica, Strain L6-D1" /LENGTH=197 /DNA_ID=CAMNT_0038874853 /DNA_START=46 /DNA_END=640 /DNA_ORIENTATION=+
MKYFLLSSLFVSSANGFTASTSNLLSSSRSTSTNLCMSTALIVQNKGGGHGELGFQLARKLASSYADKITSITILQDEADMIDQEPFKSYITDLPENVWVLKATLSNKDNEITAEGLKILLNNEPFDYVWDIVVRGSEDEVDWEDCDDDDDDDDDGDNDDGDNDDDGSQKLPAVTTETMTASLMNLKPVTINIGKKS